MVPLSSLLRPDLTIYKKNAMASFSLTFMDLKCLRTDSANCCLFIPGFVCTWKCFLYLLSVHKARAPKSTPESGSLPPVPTVTVKGGKMVD